MYVAKAQQYDLSISSSRPWVLVLYTSELGANVLMSLFKNLMTLISMSQDCRFSSFTAVATLINREEYERNKCSAEDGCVAQEKITP